MATRQTLGADPAPKSSSSKGDGGDAAGRKKRVAIMTALFVVLLAVVGYVYLKPMLTTPADEAGQANPEPVIDDPANVPPPPPLRPEPGPNDFSEIPKPVAG